MFKSKKKNVLITIALIVVLCASSFGLVYARTKSDAENEAREAAEKAAAATKNLEEAEEKMESLSKDIDANKAKIESTKADIEKKQQEINRQTDALGARLTAMYKTGTVGYIDVILSSDSISTLISNIGMVQKILKNDQGLLKALQIDQEKLNKLKEELDKKQAELEAAEAEQAALKEKFQAEADEWAAKEEKLNQEAATLAREAQDAASAQDVIDRGGSASGYVWPTVTRYCTSDYGWRICPFHGEEYHNGIDLSCGGIYGQPVYAIQDGIITRASSYGGYGNCITLKCASGVTALYGHLSGYNCSYGQYVSRGQVIGYVGSTGDSTGPHLHFTVFDSNGSAFNPWSLY